MGNVLHDQTPLVSVVMSFHNGGDALHRAIRSVLWQIYEHWELILLNDGSTDGAERMAMQFSDPRIRVLGDNVRRGLPVRLNQGVAAARGMYIARMDADDIAFPERFDRQANYLQQHPEIDLLATSALMFGNDDCPVGLLSAGLTHADICRRPSHGFPMPHPTWMGRTEWFRRHPYDEKAVKAQDQALLYRSWRSSQFAGLPDVLLGYRYAGLSVRKTLTGRYHYLRAIAAGQHPAEVLQGILTHGVAAARDLAGIATGMESRIIRARVQRIDPAMIGTWDLLLRQLSAAEPSGTD